MSRALHLSMSKPLYYTGGESELMSLPADVKLVCLHSSHLDEESICNTANTFLSHHNRLPHKYLDDYSTQSNSTYSEKHNTMP